MYTIVLKRWRPGSRYRQPEILERTEQITTAVKWYQDYVVSGQKLDLRSRELATIEVYFYKFKISEYFIEPLND
jgi:hypothetical protein